MEGKLEKLSINQAAKSFSKKEGSKPGQVAEAWDEESESDTEEAEGDADSTAKGATIPDPPPPTPSSPRGDFPRWSAMDPDVYGNRSLRDQASTSSRTDGTRRQEKSTAVASRLIAAGLGVKAPKRTEEQRTYDRAAKEREVRRKNREQEEKARAKEEQEKANTAIWD